MARPSAQPRTDPASVLTKAVLKSAELLELPSVVLARILGVSEASISRLFSGSRQIDPESKEGELALLLVRVYRSRFPSRFRRATDPGVWYGAEELETACAEVAYWRWRFLMDSDGLRDQALHTEHTFFHAKVRGRCADLTAAPWKSAARAWTQKRDYAACQDLGSEARERDLGWIRYASVRFPKGVCGAALKADALSLPRGFEQQTWDCKTARAGVYLQRRIERGQHHEFAAQSFGDE